MKHRIIAGCLFGALIAVPLPSARGQDEVRYFDHAKNAEANAKGVIQEESPGQVAVKVGTRTEKIPVGDLRDVTYQPPAQLNRLDYRKPSNKEEEARKAAAANKSDARQKAFEEALAGYREVLPKLAEKPFAQRNFQFRIAQLLAWEAEYNASQTEPAISALKQFAADHPKSWQISGCMKTLAKLYESKGDVASAMKTYESLSQVSGIPEAVRQECDLLVVGTLIDKDRSQAETKLKALQKFLVNRPESDPQRLKVDIYLASVASDPLGAIKQIDSIIAKAADNDVKALAYNTEGDVYRKIGTEEALEAAFWKYLWVDVLYSQDKAEHARALYYLSKLFESVKKDDVRAKQCRERLLKDKEFAGLDFQRRALREEK